MSATGAGTPMHLRPAGDRALLVDLEGTAQAAALAAACAADPLPGQVDAVCGAASVLLVLDRPVRRDRAAQHLGALVAGLDEEALTGPAAEHALEVVYDGEDLDEVAELTGLGREGVVAAHTGTPWTVGFGGFAPGFAYLVGGDPALEVARRSASRPRVPAGAVGLAGHHSGIYPRSSPGGWQLIGRTAAPLWDVARTPPALLAPGDAVRFTAVESLESNQPEGDAAPGVDAALTKGAGPGLEVVGVAVQTLVVDAGRPGRAGAGVPRSGPMDRGALVTANTAVGNPAWTAALEVVGGGLRLVARGEVLVAVAGAPVAVTTTSDDGVVRRRGHGVAVALRDGEILELGEPVSGLRCCVAVRGGLDVAPVLGSRCTDTLSGLGPPPLARGDVVAVGDGPVMAVAPSHGDRPDPTALTDACHPDGPRRLAVVIGPRDDWFTSSAVGSLLDQDWEVGSRSDRVGLRLRAERPLERSRHDELPTEGIAAGSLQASPDGDLVLFAADHPVTGGYPVIAVVTDADLDRVGQLRPGDRVRFTLDPDATTTRTPTGTWSPEA